MSLMFGGALSAQITSGLMGEVLNNGPSVEVTDERRTLITELADVIIPDTDTPGAKAAGAEEFIIRVIRDCHPLKAQESFYKGLERFNEVSQSAHGKNFAELDEEQKIAITTELSKSYGAFFKQMVQLTKIGYFTSEIGATEALEYVLVPGRFEGDIPFEKGQKAWAISR